MTIGNEAVKVTVLGTGGQAVFNYGFEIPAPAVCALIYTDATGAQQTLPTSAYTVSGIGNAGGGTFTYPLSGTPIAPGTSLTLVRQVPNEQQTNFTNQGAYYPATVEAALDTLEMQVQQLAEKMARAILLNIVDAGARSALPIASIRANQLLGFDGAGNPVVLPRLLSPVALVANYVTVQQYGALGDGITDDSAAIQAAINAVYARGGGRVYVPSTGHAYVIRTGLTLPSLVQLVGDGGQNWYGADQPFSVWSGKGTWFNPTDMINPCITVVGVGCKVLGINFIHNQPVPSQVAGTPYAPITYPWCIRVVQNFVELDDIHIVNATHGIAWTT